MQFLNISDSNQHFIVYCRWHASYLSFMGSWWWLHSSNFRTIWRSEIQGSSRCNQSSTVHTRIFQCEGLWKSQTWGVELVAARIINSLIDAINSENKLPKILLVTIDKDIATDVSKYDLATHLSMLQELTQWCVQQINMIVHRKRLDLLEKRPGVIAGHATTIIFVRMMRRIGNHKMDSKIGKVLELRSKFNDVGKIGQHMLTITSCNSYDHFNHKGDLSLIGKSEFWLEIDDLIHRFERNKIKLLPNPLMNTPKKTHWPRDLAHYSYDFSGKPYKLQSCRNNKHYNR